MSARRRFGSLRKLPSGRWQVRYWTPAGERVAHDETFTTKTAADRCLARIDMDLAGQTWRDPRAGQVTVADWARRWLDSAQHLKPKTRAGYESLVRSVIVPTLGSVQVKELRPMQVREWVAGLVRHGYSASRVRQAYRLLSQMLTAAQLDGLIVASPCIGVRLPKLPDHEPTILTPQQVTELAEAIPHDYGLFVRFLAYTGVRFGEAAAVAWPALDLAGKAFVVSRSLSDAEGVLSFVEPKNHQHRRITLPDALVEPLRERAALRTPSSASLVFTSPEGMALRHQNFMRRAWAPTCAALGIDATPHDLRASHASWLFDLGWSPIEIAARLGHSSASVTTKHYARRIAGRDVAIADSLDRLAVEPLPSVEGSSDLRGGTRA